MMAVRRWRTATACLALVVIAMTIYIAILHRRIQRATSYVNAGMASVSYVCGVTANALRERHFQYPAILRVADACTDVPGDDELSLRRQEQHDQDFDAVARRIDRHMEQRLLPIWGTREPDHIDDAYLPKGFRD